MNEVSEKIKKLRNTLNLTQEKFANRIGVKRGVVAQIETGKNNPTIEVINKINNAFSINLMEKKEITIASTEASAPLLHVDYLSIETIISQIGIVSIAIDKFAKEKKLKPLKTSFNRDSSRLNYHNLVAQFHNNNNLSNLFISEIGYAVKTCHNSINSDLARLVVFEYGALEEYHSAFLGSEYFKKK